LSITFDTALAIAIGIVSFQTVFLVAMALIGVAFRVPVERIQIGYSPAVRLFRFARTDIKISPNLLGGHVKFESRGPNTPYASAVVRALIAIAGPCTVILVSMIPLGIQAINEAVIAWPQMWAIATDFSTPVDANLALKPALESGGLIAAAAIVAVKGAMFNLLPLPFLSGGILLLIIFEHATGRYSDQPWPQSLLWISIVAMYSFAAIVFWRIVTGS
jgi:hypothetical protein